MTMSEVLLQPVRPIPVTFGDHFFAHGFRRPQVGEAMNPLLMFDHFWMRKDTFGWHPHRGISAVTYVFEDSKSAHHNYDTLGNNLPIHPGALHWMVAGAGVQHRERPEEENALVHALQIFVDLPAELRNVDPYAVHVEPGDIPVVHRNGHRVRVVAGDLDGVRSPARLPQPIAFYDVHLDGPNPLSIPLPEGWGAWIYTVEGSITSESEEGAVDLLPNYGFGLRGSSVDIRTRSTAHVVVIAGESISRD
jgi:redox-sensitive bicupin YhaK (pirin superfamily)